VRVQGIMVAFLVFPQGIHSLPVIHPRHGGGGGQHSRDGPFEHPRRRGGEKDGRGTYTVPDQHLSVPTRTKTQQRTDGCLYPVLLPFAYAVAGPQVRDADTESPRSDFGLQYKGNAPDAGNERWDAPCSAETRYAAQNTESTHCEGRVSRLHRS
jgi:hypothetical protein